MSSYNTAVCMMALLAANKEEYAPAILKGRAYLIKQQNHFAPDNPYNGGIGYGDKKAPPIADLSNTSLALEAIYYSQKLAKDGKYGEQPDLDWNAATEFINRCQQNPAVNKEPWVSSDKSSSAASCTARASPAPGTAKAPRLTRRNRPGPTAA
ncbi:MAG: hypothetical protein ACLT38_06700 [Akkermansia sp.]